MVNGKTVYEAVGGCDEHSGRMRKATIEKYMKYVTNITSEGNHTTYSVHDCFVVIVTAVTHNLDDVNDNMCYWARRGYIPKPLPTSLAVTTYHATEKGPAYGLYDITHRGHPGERWKTFNFDYLREATKENERELVAECVRLYVKSKAYERDKQQFGDKPNTIYHHGHIFEIVESVPVNYRIWNIGRNMPDGYLPLCKLKAVQPFEGACDIDADTLKVIKTDGAQTILAAIGGGQDTIEAMESYIKRYRNAKAGTYSYRQVERMKKALPYMRQIKWD